LSDNLLLNLTFLKSNCIQPYFIKDPSIHSPSLSVCLSLSLCLFLSLTLFVSLFLISFITLYLSLTLCLTVFLSFYISFTLFLSLRHTLILSICFFSSQYSRLPRLGSNHDPFPLKMCVLVTMLSLLAFASFFFKHTS
jgi:hypothetical protein